MDETASYLLVHISLHLFGLLVYSKGESSVWESQRQSLKLLSDFLLAAWSHTLIGINDLALSF